MTKNQPLLILITIICVAATIDLPLHLGTPTCTAIISSFDPIQLDIRFPTIKSAPQTAKFSITITSVATSQVLFESALPQGTIFRKSIELVRNTLHEVCINFEWNGQGTDAPVYIPYTQTQDFQSLINQIQIPEQLAKEDNLKAMYSTAMKLKGISGVIGEHQSKERKLEDEIVARNIHKTQRIMTLSFIECLVIVLSGVYQICALRKFLIEKNLY